MNKGIALSSILYTLLILFLALLFGILGLINSSRSTFNKLKETIFDKLNDNEAYASGAVVYFNPETYSICKEEEVNSLTETTTGCMKWYIFNDNSSSNKVNMILDHNTTSNINWNIEGINKPIDIAYMALAEDTITWNADLNVRLIEAEEIVKIIKHDSFNINATTKDEWFYFDTSSQLKISDSIGDSDYAWLFDNLSNCTKSGCDVEDNSLYLNVNMLQNGTISSTTTTQTIGYWTSSPIATSETCVWNVTNEGSLACREYTSYSGIRPVITINKSILR